MVCPLPSNLKRGLWLQLAAIPACPVLMVSPLPLREAQRIQMSFPNHPSEFLEEDRLITHTHMAVVQSCELSGKVPEGEDIFLREPEHKRL